MSRILVAWELGGGYGHLAETLPVALELRRLGHDIAFALRDLSRAETFLAAHGLRYYQAPLALAGIPAGSSPISLAEILASFGYHEPVALTGLVNGWRQIFAAERPDLLLADFAPTALLAARVEGVRAASFGTGFTIPPLAVPAPGIRPWSPPTDAQLRETEGRALGTANAALRALGAAPLSAFADIWAGSVPILRTFAEFDHYGARPATRYCPPAPLGQGGGAAPLWPSGTGPRVFGYLSATYVHFAALVEALERLGTPVLLHVRDLRPGAGPTVQRGKVRIMAERVALAPVLADADLVVTLAV